jgi:4-hydroxy-tetrahydrodipicolinate synthase
MTLFTGLSAFPLTPTDAARQLQIQPLQRILERIVIAGVDSIGLLGSTGGYAYITSEVRKRTLRAAVECVEGRTPLIVGVGALTTDDAIDLARDACHAGADGLLLAPMSYQPLTEEEVFRHFEAVAAVGELPLCIYNNPGTTKFNFSLDFIARVAKIPNVVAVKMPLPPNAEYSTELHRLRESTPEGFAVGYSGDWGAKDALAAGCACWYSVVASLLPEPALALARAAQSGASTEAERIDSAFAPLWALFREFGSFRVMFAIAETLGLGPVTPPRPILKLEPENRSRVDATIEDLLQKIS